MQNVDMTFSLLGTKSAWNIKVPMCGCTAGNTGKNSNGDDLETDQPTLHASSKKPHAA